MNLNCLAEGLKGEPSFQPFLYEDVNPLGQQTKLRILYNPNNPMRKIHARLRSYLETIRPSLPHATGALPGCSPRRNVSLHRRNRYFFVTDIVKAYENVDRDRLAEVLTDLDSQLDKDEVSDFLEKYCMLGEKGLVTGAPSCPDLYNIYAGVLLDVSLGAYCEEQGLTMTRYLDDVTISSPNGNGPIGKHKRWAIRRIIQTAGFKMNDRKTHVLDLTKGPIVINGIGLELGGRMFLPRRYHRLLRGLMHRASQDPSISLPMVAGRMGVFYGVTEKGKHLNRTEKKLAWQFDALRAKARARARS